MKKVKKEIRLSQCMIVKNEEQNIRRALSWGKDIVYEQIVVDTGSTDRTVEIAQEMGAKVFHFEWIDDFSAAKNYAIEQASGEWIAFLDADEYFTAESAGKIFAVIQKTEAETCRGGELQAILAKMINIQNGKLGVSGQHIRIFRNDPHLRYENRIHETLKYSGQEQVRAYDAREELIIYHTGYSQEAYKRTGKTQRNIRLLEKNLKDNPRDAESLAYLGDSYLSKEQYDKAKECFHRALKYGEEDKKIPPKEILRILSMLLILYARESDPKDEKTVRELYGKSREIYRDHPDPDYYFGAWLYQNRHYKEAEGYLKNALEKYNSYRGTLWVYMSGNLKLYFAQLADCCRQLEKKEDVIRYSVMSLGVDRYYTEPLVMFLNIMKEEDGEAETASKSWEILSQLYNMSSLKDQMTVLKGAKLTLFLSLENRVYNAMPAEQRRAVQEALSEK